MARSSASLSPELTYSCQLALHQRLAQAAILKQASAGLLPQCAPALDHSQSCASFTKPARTGFLSV
jgi:hypothetical protein